MPHAPFEPALAWARAQDASDPLAPFRSRFALPANADGTPLIYLCGHSLGLAPRAAATLLAQEMTDWQRLGVLGHEHARRAWIGYAEQLQPALAVLAGARSHEVVAMNSLSVNLHLLLASFYRPSAQRHAILIEAGAFSSDRHVVTSQIAWHGFDPNGALIELPARDGEDLVRIEDLEATLARDGARIALVLWPGVQYRTGQAFDLGRIVRAARAAGCAVGFDLAHAIGNVPLALHEQDADFAVWCSYKYLNGGPGAIGGAFIHERHLGRDRPPQLRGWWGHELSTRFEMPGEFRAASGAAAWALSNPPIFSTAPLLGSLPLFQEASLARLRTKSVALTGYLEFLLQQLDDAASVVTPADPGQRGCQLSVRIRAGRPVLDGLRRRRVICDWREPDIIRMAPVPLYNSFEDVWQAARELGEVLRSHA